MKDDPVRHREKLARRFPGVTIYVTEGTIEVMKKKMSVAAGSCLTGSSRARSRRPRRSPYRSLERDSGWRATRSWPSRPGTPTLTRSALRHLSSIGLVVAGDVAYNGVHQYILEGGVGGLQQWLRAIDRVADLHPRAVVAGHKNKDLPDDPAVLGETRQYLRDVIRLLDEKPTAREFFDQMIALYPSRLNPSPVWYGALGLLGE